MYILKTILGHLKRRIMFWWTLFVVFAIYFYVRAIRPIFYWKELGIPYKTPWPIIGNMGPLVFRTIPFPEYTSMLYNEVEQRYKGIYLFSRPILYLKDPELVKQVTVKDFDHFVDHQHYVTEEIDALFGKNLLCLKDKKWRNMRSTLSPAFTGAKMRAMFVLMSECADQYMSYFLKQAKKSSPVSLEMKDTFTRFANDVIATCAFGFKCDSMKERNNEFYVNGVKAADFSGLKGLKFFMFARYPMLMKLFRLKIFEKQIGDFFRKILKETIEIREKLGIFRPDLIHLFMEARKRESKYEESKVGKQKETAVQDMTLDDITSQAILFFLAGFDSITSVMCHIAHELAINPDMQEKLRSEIDQAYEQNNKITYEAIMKMKYLDMVISEGLRKWPALVLTDRVCTQPYTIQPVTKGEKPLRLEKGDKMWFSIFALHRDPKYFLNPEKFDPERFSDENKGNITASAYIPFGSGPRNCIGSRFALLEMKILFVSLLKNLKIVVTNKTEIPLKLSKNHLNLTAENGFWLGFQPRNLSKNLKKKSVYIHK